MSGDSSRRFSDGSGSAWNPNSRAAADAGADVLSPPQLLCACKIPICRKTSHSQRNPDREFYACQKFGTNAPYACKTWIWVDLVTCYVDEMVKHCHNVEIDKLQRELESLQCELATREETVSCFEREIEACQEHSIELERQVSKLQSELIGTSSSCMKFKKIRYVLLFVALSLFMVPGAFGIAATVALVVAIMYLA